MDSLNPSKVSVKLRRWLDETGAFLDYRNGYVLQTLLESIRGNHLMLMPTTRAKSANVSLEKLQSRIQGAVFVPGDLGYDDARKAWNLTVDHRRAVLVIARSTSDVVEAVRFANEKDLGIAVQSTGHGVSPHANDESMLIIMS